MLAISDRQLHTHFHYLLNKIFATRSAYPVDNTQKALIPYLMQCIWSMHRLLDTFPLYLYYELLLQLNTYGRGVLIWECWVLLIYRLYFCQNIPTLITNLILILHMANNTSFIYVPCMHTATDYIMLLNCYSTFTPWK